MVFKPTSWKVSLGLFAALAVVSSALICLNPTPGLAGSSRALETYPLRTITLRVAADEEYRSQAGWEELIRAHIGAASHAFEKNFRVRFQVKDFVSWDSNDHVGKVLSLLEELEAEVGPGGADVVLGVSGQKPPWGETLRGGARPLGSKAVVLLSRDLSDAVHPVAIAHEMGHLFGAWHVNDGGSVMSKGASSLRFDERSAEVILLARERRFKEGFGGFDQETDRRITELFDQAPPRGESNPLVPAYNNLGVTLIEESRFGEAIAALKKAYRLDPQHAIVRRSLLAAYNNQGLALSLQGDYEGAVASYSEALEVDPGSAVVNRNLTLAYTGVGVARERRGRYQEAIAAYREAIRRGTDDGTARRNLTNVYNRLLMDLADQGRFCQALTAAEEAEASGVEVDQRTLSAFKERCQRSSTR